MTRSDFIKGLALIGTGIAIYPSFIPQAQSCSHPFGLGLIPQIDNAFTYYGHPTMAMIDEVVAALENNYRETEMILYVYES